MSTGETWTDDFGTDVERLHTRSRCSALHCALHNPSSHHMRHMPQRWHAERKMIERVCDHGVGHPDPDDTTTQRTHGCDGCCDYTAHTENQGK